MRISLIGAGRVANHLAKALVDAGHHIIQLYSHHHNSAEYLARNVNAIVAYNYQDLDPNIDFIIIAVTDAAIPEVAYALSTLEFKACILHTSGSTHLNVLTEYFPRAGVLYPLQTFSLEKQVDWKEIPLLIETAHHHDLESLEEMAKTLSSNIHIYNSEQRLSLHLAAVFACNFSNYCYDIAQQIVAQEKVDFSLLSPLILETAKKATQFIPSKVQTGPALRQDDAILSLHKDLMAQKNQKDFLEVYQVLSNQIKTRHKKPDI
ncbi:Rossmann-like and DUF2520 domain-containing protein [Acinetobacter pollinis]|uniref:DUF2520 domain-containing protein n=1 Tax=Acinetobacter pollinis TaxID=2605270 RepID=A0ABU6DRH8_9GAMM|nr:Rossmann-like and DUF2520 domain-containing protein [Acinetobacter pollinis]MEB5476046.1 DUF2520 domain-containing protein [Acinetobacter pollinis]